MIDLLVVTIAFMVLNLALYYGIRNEIKRGNDRVIKTFRADMAKQNDWLLEQLYRQTPGKVLKPDEIESDKPLQKAKVYSPTADPMSEFTGERDDWHG